MMKTSLIVLTTKESTLILVRVKGVRGDTHPHLSSRKTKGSRGDLLSDLYCLSAIIRGRVYGRLVSLDPYVRTSRGKSTLGFVRPVVYLRLPLPHTPHCGWRPQSYPGLSSAESECTREVTRIYSPSSPSWSGPFTVPFPLPYVRVMSPDRQKVPRHSLDSHRVRRRDSLRSA